MSTLKICSVMGAAILLSGCAVSVSDSNDALSAYGFTNAKLGGISLFGCDGKSDGWSRTFTVTGPSGARVKGVICRGLFKGSTVRITGHVRAALALSRPLEEKS